MIETSFKCLEKKKKERIASRVNDPTRNTVDFENEPCHLVAPLFCSSFAKVGNARVKSKTRGRDGWLESRSRRQGECRSRGGNYLDRRAQVAYTVCYATGISLAEIAFQDGKSLCTHLRVRVCAVLHARQTHVDRGEHAVPFRRNDSRLINIYRASRSRQK